MQMPENAWCSVLLTELYMYVSVSNHRRRTAQRSKTNFLNRLPRFLYVCKFLLQTLYWMSPVWLTKSTCAGLLSLIPFSTWCLAACGFSPRVRCWCPARGSRLSGGSDRWAPGGPAPPRWSRSPVRWGSGCAPWVPALQRKNKVMPLFEQRHCVFWLDDRNSRRWVLIVVSYTWYKHVSCPRWLRRCCSARDSSVITLTEFATYTTNNFVWFDKSAAKDVVTSEILLFAHLNSM